MIIQHQTIELFHQPLFTWVSMRTPMEGSVPLPSEACFAYIMEGDNQMLVEEHDLRAKPGQVILSLCGHTVGEMLSEQEEGQLSTLVVHFHKEQLRRVYENGKPPLWKELDSPVSEYLVQTAASKLVSQYFTGIVHLFQHREAVTEDILVLKLKEIILLLLQTGNAPAVQKIVASLFSERSFSFREIVDAHITKPISIEQLAQLTNHSLSAFKREFKKIYDTTPGVYIIDKRIEKVANMLTLSDESISQIGYECGFTSPAHLSRVFKTKYGMTPSEYRQSLSVKELDV